MRILAVGENWYTKEEIPEVRGTDEQEQAADTLADVMAKNLPCVTGSCDHVGGLARVNASFRLNGLRTNLGQLAQRKYECPVCGSVHTLAVNLPSTERVQRGADQDSSQPSSP